MVRVKEPHDKTEKKLKTTSKFYLISFSLIFENYYQVNPRLALF
jgi:hypothetical protein